ncbi:MAG: hypothetical protein KGI06_01750 [Candidatus Micrarchaeota archaeon]|nr:hypothetical protein [Candidatus Micrarchaeota archaeon]
MAKESKGKTKEEKDIYAYYIELDSPLDLARQVFDYTPGHVKALKESGKYKLIFAGERLGDIRMIYYFQFESIGNFFVYTPGSDSMERFEMVDRISESMDYRSYRAPIVELLSNPYTEMKDLKKAGRIISIEAKDCNMLVRSIANSAHGDDSMPKMYAFFSGNDHIIGSFNFFHESGARIFTYSKTEIKEKFSTLRYNYTNDSIESANSFTEKAGIYIRVINLKKQFPFF